MSGATQSRRYTNEQAEDGRRYAEEFRTGRGQTQNYSLTRW